MPVNAPAEYFKAEERFKTAKTKEEKILALEEMLRLMPRHHGSENALAQLKSRLAKLKKTTEKKGARKAGVAKEGDAQVCLAGFTQSGKSTLLAKLTSAKPAISSHPYTTTKPEIGMMDFSGVKVQLVEIPSSFRSEYMSIARTADLVAVVSRSGKEGNAIEKILDDNFIRTKRIIVKPYEETAGSVKEKIWNSLGLIVVYAKKTKTPMALPKGATVKDFTMRIHKDFLKNFRFARLWRSGIIKQVGLSYVLENGDVLEIHAK